MLQPGAVLPHLESLALVKILLFQLMFLGSEILEIPMLPFADVIPPPAYFVCSIFDEYLGIWGVGRPFEYYSYIFHNFYFIIPTIIIAKFSLSSPLVSLLLRNHSFILYFLKKKQNIKGNKNDLKTILRESEKNSIILEN